MGAGLSSAWAKSWGNSWGNSWGLVAVLSGGASPKKRKGWANERAALEASLNPIEKEVYQPEKIQVGKKEIEQFAFEPADKINAEYRAIVDSIEAKRKIEQANQNDDNEAIDAIFAVLAWEENLIGIPASLKLSRF